MISKIFGLIDSFFSPGRDTYSIIYASVGPEKKCISLALNNILKVEDCLSESLLNDHFPESEEEFEIVLRDQDGNIKTISKRDGTWHCNNLEVQKPRFGFIHNLCA